ncbi:MAG: hypothetical protein C5B59_07420 [Bacteroidetes bacterium]|nr:MAG: hypothetical protein C5B59_07420 [Bacteroidota bacterium]
MFGLFSNKENKDCPIDKETRLWMENAFLWLAGQFGQKNIATKAMLYPTPEHFPIRYDGSKDSLLETAKIIADQMEINFHEVNIDVYEQNIQEFTGDFGYRIWTQVEKDIDNGLSSGLYFEKNENGQYEILIEKKNLSDPEKLVAIIAHEFSHIKILGEKRLDFNDESLTDLTTVIFGLGIFNANSAFKEHRSFDSYGHSSTGYLKQREWGYALALYAFYRNEEKSNWLKFLTPNIKSDFKKGMDFINANKDLIFQEKYKGG